MVDASQFPLERIAEQVRRNRKIGLGVMGWADLLYQLRIPYDSADAITLAERIMDFIETRGRAASIQLAAERGPFPAYETSIPPKASRPYAMRPSRPSRPRARCRSSRAARPAWNRCSP